MFVLSTEIVLPCIANSKVSVLLMGITPAEACIGLDVTAGVAWEEFSRSPFVDSLRWQGQPVPDVSGQRSRQCDIEDIGVGAVAMADSLRANLPCTLSPRHQSWRVEWST